MTGATDPAVRARAWAAARDRRDEALGRLDEATAAFADAATLTALRDKLTCAQNDLTKESHALLAAERDFNRAQQDTGDPLTTSSHILRERQGTGELLDWLAGKPTAPAA